MVEKNILTIIRYKYDKKKNVNKENIIITPHQVKCEYNPPMICF